MLARDDLYKLEEYAEKRPEEISPKTYLILFNKIYFWTITNIY